MRRYAFTLIELLIVVAIIAILAAIAVPNFLEAQTRSKVARVRADHRAIALGMEAYKIDQTKYIIDEQILENKLNLSNNREVCRRHSMKLMTTPVAYLSSIYFDIFQEKYPTLGAGSLPDKRNVYVIRVMESIKEKNPNANPNTNNWVHAYNLGYSWLVKSNGPMRHAPGDAALALLLVADETKDVQVTYDPTNGTMSNGIIVTTNQGAFTGQKR